MPQINENQIAALSRLFSAALIQELSKFGRSPLLARLIKESSLEAIISGSDKVSQLFETAFSLLKKKEYRHEYIYKAALTEKVLLGIHSLQTASMLTELRVGGCKADLVILNGTATVYEIKSERDNLIRLRDQIAAYRKVFASVNVIAGEKHIDEIFDIVPEDVGVLRLSDRYQITTLRQSADIPERTQASDIFDVVRISEAKKILQMLGTEIPNVPNTKMYRELRALFSELEASEAHRAMVKILKSSRSLLSLQDLIGELPPSLHAAILTTSVRKRDYNKILQAINTPVRDALRWA